MQHDICIIGQEKNESDLKLLEEAKKKFDSVFFVPINMIGIGLTDRFSISYRKTDLFKFPGVLPRIPSNYSTYAYQLLSMFPETTYLPIKPISFLLAEDRFFLMTVMRKRGVSTLNVRLALSQRAADRIIDDNTFPLIIRASEEKTGVVVNNKTEAKSIVDALASLTKPILVEDVVKDVASLYVVGSEVVASIKKKTDEKDIVFGRGEFRQMKPNIETEHLALDAASAIGSKIARVDISMEKEPKVANVILSPNLTIPTGVAGVNIPQKIVEFLHDNLDSHMKKPLLMKFFEDAGSVMKDVLKTKNMVF